jgi:hypothetical protein
MVDTPEEGVQVTAVREYMEQAARPPQVGLLAQRVAQRYWVLRVRHYKVALGVQVAQAQAAAPGARVVGITAAAAVVATIR